MTAHHAYIDIKNPGSWGSFVPALVASKPDSGDPYKKDWRKTEANHPLLAKLPTQLDVGKSWRQSNSGICSQGWIDVPVSFADGKPLAAIRWDLAGVLTSVGFQVDESGSKVLLRLVLNALALKRNGAEKAVTKTPSKAPTVSMLSPNKESPMYLDSPFSPAKSDKLAVPVLKKNVAPPPAKADKSKVVADKFKSAC